MIRKRKYADFASSSRAPLRRLSKASRTIGYRRRKFPFKRRRAVPVRVVKRPRGVRKGRKAKNSWKRTAKKYVKRDIEKWSTKKTRACEPISIAPYEPGLVQTTGYAVVPYMDNITGFSASSQFTVWGYSINPFDPYCSTGGHTPAAFTKLKAMYAFFEIRKVDLSITFSVQQLAGGAAGNSFFTGPFEVILQKSQDNLSFPRSGGAPWTPNGYYKGPYCYSSPTNTNFSIDWSRAYKQKWFKRHVHTNPDRKHTMSMSWTPADYNMTAESAEEADFRQIFANFASAQSQMNEGTPAGFWIMVRPMTDQNAFTYRYNIDISMKFTLLCQKSTSTPADVVELYPDGNELGQVFPASPTLVVSDAEEIFGHATNAS